MEEKRNCNNRTMKDCTEITVGRVGNSKTKNEMEIS